MNHPKIKNDNGTNSLKKNIYTLCNNAFIFNWENYFTIRWHSKKTKLPHSLPLPKCFQSYTHYFGLIFFHTSRSWYYKMDYFRISTTIFNQTFVLFFKFHCLICFSRLASLGDKHFYISLIHFELSLLPNLSHPFLSS